MAGVCKADPGDIQRAETLVRRWGWRVGGSKWVGKEYIEEIAFVQGLI